MVYNTLRMFACKKCLFIFRNDVTHYTHVFIVLKRNLLKIQPEKRVMVSMSEELKASLANPVVMPKKLSRPPPPGLGF